MTTPSTPRKAGPYTGDGSQDAWPFAFKVFAASDVKVTVGDATGAESVLVLNTDYTVALNANQETSPGGTITYLLPNGYKLTVTGDLDYDQPLDLPSGGNFNPTAIENQLDRATMQIQQLAEQMVRAVKVPVTDDGTGELSGDLAQGILVLAPAVGDITTVAGGLSQVTTVSTNIADVNTVAGNLADVTNFADVYLGPAASDPTTRTDGGPLQTGDLYFNTAIDRTRIYGVAGWVDVGTASPVTIATQVFNGDGSQTTFTLSSPPAFEAACDVFIGGVAQKVDVDYNIAGTSLVFTSAPPLGTGNIYVKILSAYAGGVPNDGSVTPAKVAPGTYDIDISGNAATATTAGSATTAGNAATATKLQTARTIGGVAFDGTANINLPGVNAPGNQDTSGNAATATTDNQHFGISQSWQDVTSSRAHNTTYTNTTGKTILATARSTQSSSATVQAFVNGGTVALQTLQVGGAVFAACVTFAVPPGATYSVTFSGSTVGSWMEFR